MANGFNLVGQKFGLWLVKVRVPSVVRGQRRFLCQCECGTERILASQSLRTGHSKSCGCNANVKHGHARNDERSRAYMSYQAMKNRCYNPNDPFYADYGGRGIKVCERWQSFRAFLEDMGEPPPGLTLDRVDNAGNYEKDNCRWATRAQQSSNRRVRKDAALIKHLGVMKPIYLWAQEYRLDSYRLRWRLNAGWSIEKALNTPVRPMRRKA